MKTKYTFSPLTKSNWNDFVELFGKNGACGGCWCMYWRIARKEFHEQKGEGNREAMHKLVRKGESPGILAYDGVVPVGWCAVAPRDEYSTLSRSRVLSPVDEKPVWSVVCFFIAKTYRNKGVATDLLKAAVEFVKQNGGKILEGYPTKSNGRKSPDPFVYTGMESMFDSVGFKEAARRSPKRPIMRYAIKST